MSKKLFLAPLALALLATPGSLWSVQAGYEPGQAAPTQAPAALQTAAGELSRVDPGSQSFWIKTADGSEMEFKYTDTTEVAGAADSAEGLASMSGNRVNIQFEKVAGDNIASQIEVLPRS